MASITSTTQYAVAMIMGSKLFYANGLWWMFYTNGTNLCYATNPTRDCATASFNSGIIIQNNSTNISSTQGWDIGVVTDGTYVHYVRCPANTNTGYYRRGLLNADGTITWTSNEVTAVTAAGNSLILTSIDMDSSGHVLVGFYAENKARVGRNANTDGTWTSDAAYGNTGMIVSGNLADSVNHRPCVVALKDNKWAVVTGGVTGSHMYINWWNGSALQYSTSQTPLQFTDVVASAYSRLSVTSIGDDVYCAWNGGVSPYYIYVRKWTYGTTTMGNSTVAVQSSVDYRSTPAIRYNQTANQLVVYWTYSPTSGGVYCRTSYDGATWNPAVGSGPTAIATGLTVPDPDSALSACIKDFNDVLPFLYLTGSGTYTINIGNATFDAGIATAWNSKSVKICDGTIGYNGAGPMIV